MRTTSPQVKPGPPPSAQNDRRGVKYVRKFNNHSDLVGFNFKYDLINQGIGTNENRTRTGAHK